MLDRAAPLAARKAFGVYGLHALRPVPVAPMRRGRPVQNPLYRHDPFVVAKGRCISDAFEAAAETRRIENDAVLKRLNYGKICPGCDQRYGRSLDGFIDLVRCPKCEKPVKYQRR